ncbi:hypothetical protein Krac_10490 [Ktedonobacter racemifer DSM 44963]|uniref:Uncharacterized protein n=1 Tax=Ktedonobacter racemifer DSM 44963 TaxID=485913 RepID=D6THG5_KTERA|nr:hypothetical protein Krac_10490 [Ktedonobacter racemifer DSM 44963]
MIPLLIFTPVGGFINPQFLSAYLSSTALKAHQS